MKKPQQLLDDVPTELKGARQVLAKLAVVEPVSGITLQLRRAQIGEIRESAECAVSLFVKAGAVFSSYPLKQCFRGQPGR